MKSLLALLLLTSFAAAADWENISDSVVSQVKPGPFGPAAGVAVDRVTGRVFMVVSDQGLWRSDDHGQTFARCDGKAIGGRCETGWALQADPAGKRLACFMIYGSSAMTTDGGDTWTKFKSTHFDFGSVDWADTGRRLLALRHESGGMLATSEDGGATWQDLGKGFKTCAVVDHATFLATKEKEAGIFRSTDAGATWSVVANSQPTAGVPVISGGVVYWPDGRTILVSRDGGLTWTESGAIAATHGPFLGPKTERMMAVGKGGFFETADAGKTWQPVAPLPAGFGVGRVGPHYAWDAGADLFYASTMGKPAFRYPHAAPSH